MSSSTAAIGATRLSTSYACVRCSERKVKCDRKQPCTACLRFNFECAYRAPGLRKRQKRTALDHGNLDQRRRYENVADFQLPGIDSSKAYESSLVCAEQSRNSCDGGQAGPTRICCMTTSASVAASEPGRRPSSSQIIFDHGNSKYLESAFWTRIVKEFPTPEEVFETASAQGSDEEYRNEYSSDLLIGLPKTSSDPTSSAHPPDSQIIKLWQVFKGNVDSIVKIIHAPSVETLLRQAMANRDRIAPDFEALMYAIYSLTAYTLTEKECEESFGESRQSLLSRYRLATQRALVRVKVLRTTNLVVLQAFTYHLLSIQDTCDPHTLWTLAGIAMRLAEGIGLHRDGQVLGLPPFETELRRRIWWQLYWFDSRISELVGAKKFKDLYFDGKSPRLPANINDEALVPGMKETPESSNRLTDLLLCAVRWEVVGFWTNYVRNKRHQGLEDGFWSSDIDADSMQERDHIIDQLEETLETKYLRYVDPAEPVQLMAMMFARATIAKMRFLSHHPRRWVASHVPEAEGRFVWKLCTKLLDGHIKLCMNPQLHGFAWHVSFHYPWEALIHVLDSLCANPCSPGADDAWNLVHQTFDLYPSFVDNAQMPVHVAVGNLCLRAQRAREIVLATQGMPLLSPPEYIVKIHQQREKSKARQQEREIRNQNTKSTPTPLANSSVPPGGCGEAGIEQTTTGDRNLGAIPHPPATAQQARPSMADDTSWPSIGYGECSLGDHPIMGKMSVGDLDLMPTEDHNKESWFEETMDWTQWDALLGTAGINGQ